MWARGQLHIPQPDDPDDADAEFNEAMAAMGLVASEADGAAAAPADMCYLWPCNLPTWKLWHRLQTQWRVGMDGKSGLDYGAVAVYMGQVACVRRKEFAKTFSALQAMERAALAAWDAMRK